MSDSSNNSEADCEKTEKQIAISVNLRRAAKQQLESFFQAGVSDLSKPKEPIPITVYAPALSESTSSEPASLEPTSLQPESRQTNPATAPSTATPPATPPPIAKTTLQKSSEDVVTILNSKTQNDDNAERQKLLDQLSQCVAGCQKCPTLANARLQTVFGVGNPAAKIMFLGEAPGADEDRTGEPFVGRAGQLLTKIIGACGWSRDELYICNILRCRPPGNRNPTQVEADNCREYLDAQIAIVKPDYIVCWGTVAAHNLLDTKKPIGQLRSSFFEYHYEHHATPYSARVLCTYHPSYLLRTPDAKVLVWEDMKLLLRDMGIDPDATSQRN